ncbi:MAG: hypothetical protein ACXVFV_09820, partial [Mycobacteriales bacterium]
MMERIRREAGDDEGIGMILVIAMVGILTSLMVVMTAVGVTSLRSSRKHVSFEGALSAAESGIDEALARAQKAYNTGGSDSYATPSATDPNCTLTSVAWPFTSQPTPSQEQSWAKSTLQSIATTASCRSRSADGDFVYLKPTGHQAVYAMGFAPSYGANEMKTRLLKAEYLFTPYAPTNAILTGKSVTLGSSTTVTTAPPSDPTLAAVHTNGNLYVDTGNPTVYGPVSQSGTGTGVSSNKFYANTG